MQKNLSHSAVLKQFKGSKKDNIMTCLGVLQDQNTDRPREIATFAPLFNTFV